MTLPPLLAIAKGRRARPRKAVAPRPKEIALHMAVADMLRRFARTDWRWSHFPSGEARDERTGAKLKAMGLQKGWPDFVLFSPVVGQLHALELKREGEDLTDQQREFRAWCFCNSIPYATAWSIDDAMAALGRFGVLRINLSPRGLVTFRRAGGDGGSMNDYAAQLLAAQALPGESLSEIVIRLAEMEWPVRRKRAEAT